MKTDSTEFKNEVSPTINNKNSNTPYNPNAP